MDIIDKIFDEAFIVIVVLCAVVVFTKFRNFLFGGGHSPKPPEVGTGYLSSFADDDTGFPSRSPKDTQPDTALPRVDPPPRSH